MKLKVETLLESIFKRDYIENQKFSHISQIGIVTVKSLIPSKEDLGIRIDYKRFGEELKLWNFYKTDEDSLISKFNNLNKDLYFKLEDNTIISRVGPLAIINHNVDILEEEIIKSLLYTTGNILEVFYGLIIGYKIFYLMEDLEDDDINERIKDRIINFSQKDYIEKYASYYKFPIEQYNGNYSVDFEMTKIGIINIFNDVINSKYERIEEIIKLTNKEDLLFMESNILSSWILDNIDMELPKFYLDLGDYLLSLRKSRIDPDSLQIDEYILPDIFQYEEGDVFFHSLLKNARVIKKERVENSVKMAVKTKIGIYILKK